MRSVIREDSETGPEEKQKLDEKRFIESRLQLLLERLARLDASGVDLTAIE